ncbi:MAG: M23 family metallopeptidase, partial [Ignavibacteria bacterium]
MKTLLIFLNIILLSAVHSQVKKVGDDVFTYNQEAQDKHCMPEVKFNPLIHENAPMAYDFSAASFIWPFENELDDEFVLVNYVDDQSGSTIKDYMGYTWSYNGHRGTDICLHDFRHMDRFVAVKAAEAGTVIEIAFNNWDRNTGWDNSPANYVLIRHQDGSYAYYYHLMRKSVTVRVGEYLIQGQNIGYVGSSGNSTDAHLHFEPGYFQNGVWNKRDPWHGTFNTLPTMWQSQYGYVAGREFKLADMGVYTASNVQGDPDDSTTSRRLKERIIAPVTVSGYEPEIGIWMQYQATYSLDPIKIEIRKPNGTLFNSTQFNNVSQVQYGWTYWTPNFDVGVAETGNWYARILFNGVEQGRTYFNVQLLTSNRPRIWPEAAQCFRKSIFVQKDTLRVRPIRTNMQYDLVNAPASVTLTNDSILTIGAFDNIFRVREFKVIASIGGSATLRDTMIYKLIDTTKNNPFGNGIESLELNAKIEGLWNGSTMVGDTVDVIIRGSITPYSILETDRIKLNSQGFGIANFFNTSAGIYYYIVVKHRNSIETWAKTVQRFTSGYPISYDFTTSKTKAYGDNLKYKGGE